MLLIKLSQVEMSGEVFRSLFVLSKAHDPSLLAIAMRTFPVLDKEQRDNDQCVLEDRLEVRQMF